MKNETARTCYAVIPARGGSKGIINKNLRKVGGKSLIRISVEAAIAAKHIGRVFVSTDSNDIAQEAVDAGAIIIERPVELCSDDASSESALLHAIEWWANNGFIQPQCIVFIQCTSPLTLPEDIDGTVQAMLNDDADCALSVTPFHYFLWKNSPGGAVGINHDKSYRQRRQEREDEFLETGAVYVMRRDGFLDSGHRFFGRIAFYVMPKERVLEIDELADLKLADAMLGVNSVAIDE